MSIAEQSIAAPSNSEDQPRLRDLFLFSAGGRTFGIFSEEVEGTAEAKHPTPLPHAPAAILGVVYARGRMLTLRPKTSSRSRVAVVVAQSPNGQRMLVGSTRRTTR